MVSRHRTWPFVQAETHENKNQNDEKPPVSSRIGCLLYFDFSRNPAARTGLKDPSRLWYICTMAEDKGVINLRGVPVSLIRRAKAAAALQGKTLRVFVIEAIQEKIRKRP